MDLQIIEQIGTWAAVIVASASVLASALERLTGITPLDAEDVHLGAVKKGISKAQKVLGKLGFHPPRQ